MVNWEFQDNILEKVEAVLNLRITVCDGRAYVISPRPRSSESWTRDRRSAKLSWLGTLFLIEWIRYRPFHHL